MAPPSALITHLLLVLSSVTVAGAADGQAEIAGFPVLPDGFSPRYYGEAPPEGLLARRQGGACSPGWHDCLDLGELGTDVCCPVDRYCFFKTGNWSIGCCGFGDDCDGKCTSAGVRVNVTTTSAYTVTPSDGTTTSTQSSGILQTVLESTTTATVQMCSSRPCAVSWHLCPTLLGGKCCPNEQTCASGGSCIAPVTTTSALVPTAGCSGTLSAFSCTVGGGCCLSGQSCAYVDQTAAACAGTADNAVAPDGNGLSQGAKAGIGVGIAVGAAIVIAGVTWFCIRHRRQAAGNRPSGAAGTAAAGLGGGEGRGGGGIEEGIHDSQYHPVPRGPTPGGEGTVTSMSEGSGPATYRLHQGGTTRYHGPNAQRGPFTQYDDGQTYEFRPAVNLDQGVPLNPHDPADIRMAVEVAADQPYEDYLQQKKPQQLADVVPVRGASTRSAAAESTRTRDNLQSPDVYELQGSYGDPSPMSQEVEPLSSQPGSPRSPRSPQSPSDAPGNPGSISPQGDTLQSWHGLDFDFPSNNHYRS